MNDAYLEVLSAKNAKECTQKGAKREIR